MSNQTEMKCPSCGGVDITDFSTCRFCSKKYDGSSETTTSELANMPPVSDSKSIIKWGLISLIVCGSVFAIHVTQTHRADRLDSIRQSVVAAGRPRAMFFMNDWGAPGQAYVSTVNDEAEKFGASIDFVRLTSTDPENKELVDMLGVRESPITSIFDKNGHESKTISGSITHQELERYLENALRQGK